MTGVLTNVLNRWFSPVEGSTSQTFRLLPICSSRVFGHAVTSRIRKRESASSGAVTMVFYLALVTAFADTPNRAAG
jgi:hypothetical protein